MIHKSANRKNVLKIACYRCIMIVMVPFEMDTGDKKKNILINSIIHLVVHGTLSKLCYHLHSLDAFREGTTIENFRF